MNEELLELSEKEIEFANWMNSFSEPHVDEDEELDIENGYC
jgi:hypothetical protein